MCRARWIIVRRLLPLQRDRPYHSEEDKTSRRITCCAHLGRIDHASGAAVSRLVGVNITVTAPGARGRADLWETYGVIPADSARWNLEARG